jgi:hypothetical protein
MGARRVAGVMAFLTTPKHGGWLIAATAIWLTYIGFKLLIPPRRKCCGLLWTPEQYNDHVKRRHHHE